MYAIGVHVAPIDDARASHRDVSVVAFVVVSTPAVRKGILAESDVTSANEPSDGIRTSARIARVAENWAIFIGALVSIFTRPFVLAVVRNEVGIFRFGRRRQVLEESDGTSAFVRVQLVFKWIGLVAATRGRSLPVRNRVMTLGVETTRVLPSRIGMVGTLVHVRAQIVAEILVISGIVPSGSALTMV